MKKIFTSLFFLSSIMFVNGQNASPGGIQDQLTLWIKSNAGTSTTTNGGLLNSWSYVNDPTKSFTAIAGDQPIYNNNIINFLPAVSFAGSEMMDGPTGSDAPITAGNDDYAIFAVWKSIAGPGRHERIWSQRTNDPSPYALQGYGASLMTWDHSTNGPSYGDQAEIPPHHHTVSRSYVIANWNISQLNLLNQAINDLEIYDDRNLAIGPLIINTDPALNGAERRDIATDINRLGARDNAAQETFNGQLAELIVFNRSVTSAEERLKIFSYLAIKYGISIKTNIISSAGTIIWDATANATYNNAVFGLGRDDNSDLMVTTSNSIETGSGDGAGQPGTANIILSEPSSLVNDNNFLVIGNNGDPLTISVTDIPAAAIGSQRLVREWKVQHTGNVGTINLDFDFTGIDNIPGIGTLMDFRLVVDADGDGDFTTGNQRYYAPTGFTGNVANFTGITLLNNEIFMIITQATSEVPLPVKWISFSGKRVNAEVVLNWEVENNEMAKHYEIQYSTDGIQFFQAGIVMNQADVKQYSFVHNQQQGNPGYYRIHQVDLDGKTVYSKIIYINSVTTRLQLRINGNPIRNNLIDLSIATTQNDIANMELINISGIILQKWQFAIKDGTNSISVLVNNLSAGQYFLRVRTKNDVQMLQLVKF